MSALEKIANGELDKLQDLDGKDPTFQSVVGHPQTEQELYFPKMSAVMEERNSMSSDAGDSGFSLPPSSLAESLTFFFIKIQCDLPQTRSEFQQITILEGSPKELRSYR